MKCDKCNSEWKVDASRLASIIVCPFCQEKLKKEGEWQSFDNTKDLLVFVASEYGSNAIFDRKYFADHTSPLMPQGQRHIMKQAFDCGAVKILQENMTSDQGRKDIAIKQAISKLTDLMFSQEAAEQMIREFSDAIGWSVQKPTNTAPTPKPVNPPPQPKPNPVNSPSAVVTQDAVNVSPIKQISPDEKRLNYVDNMKGFFSGDYEIMRAEYLSLANKFKDASKLRHCRRRATECLTRYNTLIAEEKPRKKLESKKDIIGSVFLFAITILYMFILWGTGDMRAVWESSNYFLPLVPLLVYSLLMVMINVIFHRNIEDNNGAAISLILIVIVALAQIITLSIWFFGYDFRILGFIGHLLFHLLFSFFVFTVISALKFSTGSLYYKGTITITVINNPSNLNKNKSDAMINRYKKVYKDNPEIMAVVYNNIANAYDYLGDLDMALKYKQMVNKI